MTLLLILVAMTVAAALAVIWPLIRNVGDVRSGSDVVVYRDQLDEIERDLASEHIGNFEAKEARVEISRRLLAAADAMRAASTASGAASLPWRRRIAAGAALLALPTLAGGLYLWLGSPELASAQQQTPPGIAAAEDPVDNLVAQAEAHLQRNPEDGRGWEILAPVYMRLDRYSDWWRRGATPCNFSATTQTVKPISARR